MKFCQIHCAMALLGLTLAICSQVTSSQPDLDIQSRRLLQRARAAGMAPQAWSRRAVEDYLSLLTEPEAELHESVVPQGGDQENLRMELERSVDDSNILPPRERKAGCKNFYWKGFTSC
ncbi:hypothetical protein UPYG_G00205730 [Umbra pygmaea]|uniref:Somatostatin-2 n=1 Tax=Umbra pygmaea TaxID=75934 RepID=A0ABD0WJ24_UMBPY